LAITSAGNDVNSSSMGFGGAARAVTRTSAESIREAYPIDNAVWNAEPPFHLASGEMLCAYANPDAKAGFALTVNYTEAELPP
jgi:hypothetical protein